MMPRSRSGPKGWEFEKEERKSVDWLKVKRLGSGNSGTGWRGGGEGDVPGKRKGFKKWRF